MSIVIGCSPLSFRWPGSLKKQQNGAYEPLLPNGIVIAAAEKAESGGKAGTDAVIPAQLPDPDSTPPATDRPVKVYILSGQSNMVGMGDIKGGTSRWGKQFLNPVASVYPGEYSPDADYDTMQPIETKRLEKFGGVRPDPLPRGGTAVIRGAIRMPNDGIYGFNAGYANSSYSIMEVDGKEVYRREVGKEPVRASFRFAKDREYPFKITFLTGNTSGLYEQNLVNLIKAWRKEFNAPKAPWVIATIGFGGWELAGPHLTVANAQLAVSGENGEYSEFKGNVLTVETRDFWRDVSVSPKNQGYHYNRNAETYMLVGDALGRGMVKLLETCNKEPWE